MAEEGIIMHMVINGVIQFHFSINSQEENKNARWSQGCVKPIDRIAYILAQEQKCG